MNLIVALILLLIVGGCLWGIYVMIGKKFPPPSMVNVLAGIILILVFLLVTFYLVAPGRMGIGERHPAIKRPAFQNTIMRIDVPYPPPRWPNEAVWA